MSDNVSTVFKEGILSEKFADFIDIYVDDFDVTVMQPGLFGQKTEEKREEERRLLCPIKTLHTKLGIRMYTYTYI